MEDTLYDQNGFIESKEPLEFDDKKPMLFSECIEIDENLPPIVDLHSEMTEIEDQVNNGTCVANACAGALEYLLKVEQDRVIDVSRIFIYYNAREKLKEKHPNIGKLGCTLVSAIETLYELGTCEESICEYDPKRIDIRPDQNAYDNSRYKIIEAYILDWDLKQMKTCLAQGFPFIFGIRITKRFSKSAKMNKGCVQFDESLDIGPQNLPGHCMLAVGYSDKIQSFIVRNSWGKNWGDEGYCYIPYEYMTHPKLIVEKPYVISNIHKHVISTEHWNEDDYDEYVQYTDDGDDAIKISSSDYGVRNDTEANDQDGQMSNEQYRNQEETNDQGDQEPQEQIEEECD